MDMSVTCTDLIVEARELLEAENRGSEYARGICELIARACGVPGIPTAHRAWEVERSIFDHTRKRSEPRDPNIMAIDLEDHHEPLPTADPNLVRRALLALQALGYCPRVEDLEDGPNAKSPQTERWVRRAILALQNDLNNLESTQSAYPSAEDLAAQFIHLENEDGELERRVTDLENRFTDLEQP